MPVMIVLPGIALRIVLNETHTLKEREGGVRVLRGGAVQYDI